MISFSKYHALGNDYLVIDPAELDGELTAAHIRLLCHRNFGVGSDGILLGPLPDAEAAFALRIFNPDGSEAEKSGNGLRIFSRFLHDRGLVGGEEFHIATAGGTVTARVTDGGRTVRVDMGRVSFRSSDIPVVGDEREVLDETLEAGGEQLVFSAATIGNPHCVVRSGVASGERARRLGPLIENLPIFPRRTNVQFIEILDRSNMRVEIWERGAGYTLASGSSASACAAVARRLGLCDPRLTVHMAGGSLEIVVSEEFEIRMTGPVTHVAEGNVHEEAFAGGECDG